MSKIIFKIIPALIFWGIFIFVIFNIPYPDSLTQANFLQAVSFFIPLFLAITLTLNIFLKNILLSVSIALCMKFLLILKALDSLNLVTGILTIITGGLFISYFKNIKKRGSGFKHLTKQTKIPKLMHIRKHSASS